MSTHLYGESAGPPVGCLALLDLKLMHSVSCRISGVNLVNYLPPSLLKVVLNPFLSTFYLTLNGH